MQPIETFYNNYRFRSRLEARWAVFFDTAGIEYRYEPEGFELGDGMRYLPDFYLPHPKKWVEIKPGVPTPLEREKVMRLCGVTRQSAVILAGNVWTDVQVLNFIPLTDSLREHLMRDRTMHAHQYYWFSTEECIAAGGMMGANLKHDCMWTFCEWSECPNCHEVGLVNVGETLHHSNETTCHKPTTPDEDRLVQAFIAARQAQFEHNKRNK